LDLALPIATPHPHAHPSPSLISKVVPQAAGARLLRKREAVTEVDRGAVKMRAALEARAAAVAREEARFESRHAAYLAKKRAGTVTRPESLMMARRYRDFKARKSQLINGLDTLQQALDTLYGLDVDKELVAAMQLATDALRRSREESGLTVDAVDEAREDLKDEMDEVAEVSDAIGEIGAAAVEGVVEDDDPELLAELEALGAEAELEAQLAGLAIGPGGAAPATRRAAEPGPAKAPRAALGVGVGVGATGQGEATGRAASSSGSARKAALA